VIGVGLAWEDTAALDSLLRLAKPAVP